MGKHRKKIQLGTLILFVALMILGKIQIWMAVFLGGLLLSTFKGRFYCGYICPINTVMEKIDNDEKKMKRKRKEVPKWIKGSWFRFLILAIFLGTMFIVLKTGKRLPILPLLFSIGVVLTLFYQPSLWHKYLCPYGTLFSIFSRKNNLGYEVWDEGCIKCGICVKTCPADAIRWTDKNNDPVIIKSDCLVCGKCEESCPKKVISMDDTKVLIKN